MGTIQINGITIETNGANVFVSNGKIIVDGKEVKVADSCNVTILGDVGNLNVTGRVEVKGKVKGDVDAGGSVHCGNVGGSVDAGGSITASDIKGNADAGGSINMER